MFSFVKKFVRLFVSFFLWTEKLGNFWNFFITANYTNFANFLDFFSKFSISQN